MKLTVAIPTYNRADCIKESLDSILSQVNNDVEVIVCDNASTDNTRGVLAPYINSEKIKYYGAEQNGGMDFNFLRCLQYAAGDYVLLFSDDDILLSGAINKIISLIDNENPDYINLNSTMFTKSVDEINEQSVPRMILRTESDLISTDKKECIEYLGVFLTYLSATVIKRENFLKVENPQKYYGTYFIHAHIVLETLHGENKKIVITKEPFVGARMGNSGGFNLYEVWVKQYKKLLLENAVANGFPLETMRRIYVNDINGFIKDSIKYYRFSKNTYGMKRTFILFKYTKEFPSVWFNTWSVAVAPYFFIRIWYGIKRRVVKLIHLGKK